MNAPEPWTLLDYFSAIGRYKGRFLFILLLSIGAGVAFIVYMPKKYESEAKLFVRVGRENAMMDPTVMKGEQISLNTNSSRELEMNTIVEHLRSRGILEKAFNQLFPVSPSEDVEVRERNFLKFKKDLNITSPRQSTIVSLTAKGASPEEAQLIAATIMNLYLDAHMRVSRPLGSQEFLTEQSTRMHEEYQRSLAELRDAKNQGGIASIEGRRSALESQVSSVEAQLHQVGAEHAAAIARLKSKRGSLENLPNPLLKQLVGGQPNDGLAQMRDRLFQLQVQQEELRSKFSDTHPNVTAVNKQVQELTDILSSENPEREQIIVTLCADDEARQAALDAQEQNLKMKLNELQKSLANHNQAEIVVTEASLKVRQLESKYLSYAANSEDARIDDALRSDKISNLSVIQPASLSPLAVFPQKSTTLLIAGFFGLIGGMFTALVSEQIRRIRQANEYDAAHSEHELKQLGIAATPDYSEQIVVARPTSILQTKSH